MANDETFEAGSVAPVGAERSAGVVRIVRGIAGLRVLLGLVLLIFLIGGFSPGTGAATAILVVLGVAFVVHGAISWILAKSASDSIAIISICVDSFVVVAGLTALLLAWEKLSLAGAMVLLGGIVFAALDALVLAVVRTWPN
ncbi:hypothetical protein [Nocardia sp. NPDC058114]|uniref:hypothetical protein n=1 Tax=Nocardia sp. NPDC058114 TaxID=3346346 RepID=UPI0036DA48A9